jgi:multidrug efflux pump subunit AcrA (membrane-fusion protein)
MLIALPLIYLATGCAPETASHSPGVRPVKTMVVTAGEDTRMRSFPGKVEASKTVELAFLVSGLLVKLPVREGQLVAKGEVIAQLRQDEFQAQLKILQSQLDQARADLVALRAGERTEQKERLEAKLRAADLHLDPDLNDGVVLNVAPLWELVPWKEAKNYWEELVEGKYEWSSIGKQMRENGLVK